MKRFFSSTVLFLVLSAAAHAEGACDETAEMKRAAEEYRKCAAENKEAKLDECEQEAPEIVKTAANKVVQQRRNMGNIEEQLANAYEAGDKKSVHQLHRKKAEAELDYEFSEKEKRVAWALHQVEELARDLPGSAEAAQLKQKTTTDFQAYLDNARKSIEARKAEMAMESKMESIEAKIEIIRKKEELKRLEAEAGQSE